MHSRHLHTAKCLLSEGSHTVCVVQQQGVYLWWNVPAAIFNSFVWFVMGCGCVGVLLLNSLNWLYIRTRAFFFSWHGRSVITGGSLEPTGLAVAAVARGWQWEPGNASPLGRASGHGWGTFVYVLLFYLVLPSLMFWCFRHDSLACLLSCRTDGGHNCQGSSKSFRTCNTHVIIL